MERFEHGGNIYEARRRQNGGETLLDFSANINPLGLSDRVREAILEALPHVVHYPDAKAVAIKAAISGRYGLDAEYAVPGNGAAELLYVLCQMARPSRVLVTAPSFSEYEKAARAAGAEVEYYYLSPVDDFRINVSEYAEHIPRGGLVFLCNPNNPTGKILSRQEVETIVSAAAEREALCLVDESFLDFLPDEETYSVRTLLDKYPELIILRSLTKFYAIPGLRLGFLWANQKVRDMLSKGRDPWNVNTLAQAAGVAALADESYRSASIQTVTEARRQFFDALNTLPGLKPFPSCANFMLADISGTGYRAGDLRKAMLANKVLIRDCSNFPGLSADYIRLAVRSPRENQMVVEAFRSILCKGSDGC